MSATPQAAEPITAPAPVETAAQADAIVAHATDVMEQLAGVMREETELLRAGRLGAASKLAEAKADLTRLYIADTLRLRASRTALAQVAPDRLTALRERHESFRSLVQINQTVLATAHAVSEGIVRGVSGEMARKSAPQTYGASGRTNTPGKSASAPLAVSRTL
jgi:flagellar biosynthesis/type III secretory pathway chaperone